MPIKRIWHGWTTPNNADAYEAIVQDEVFPAIEVLMDAHVVDVTITGVLQHMAARGRPFGTCDVSGMLWVDVDTPDDYQTADALLRASYGERV